MKILFIFFIFVLNLYSDEFYFLPKQSSETKEKISELILNAKSNIMIAMYNFSYEKFAKDLIVASKKGIKIVVLLDAQKVEKNNTIVKLLNKNGIKTIISKEKMHLKVAVIDSKIAILGSTNWTEESFEENYDFIYITNEEKIINSLLDFINSFN